MILKIQILLVYKHIPLWDFVGFMMGLYKVHYGSDFVYQKEKLTIRSKVVLEKIIDNNNFQKI